MEDINVNESNENEVLNEVREDEFEETSGSNSLVGLAIGVGIGALSAVAYKKLVKPAMLKIKDKIKKSKKTGEPVIEDVEIKETVVED